MCRFNFQIMSVDVAKSRVSKMYILVTVTEVCYEVSSPLQADY